MFNNLSKNNTLHLVSVWNFQSRPAIQFTR